MFTHSLVARASTPIGLYCCSHRSVGSSSFPCPLAVECAPTPARARPKLQVERLQHDTLQLLCKICSARSAGLCSFCSRVHESGDWCLSVFAATVQRSPIGFKYATLAKFSSSTLQMIILSLSIFRN